MQQNNKNKMANEEDYFIAANSVGAINEEQYKKLDVLIHTTEAISRSLYQSVYLIDYYKKGFLYVSENPLFLCGHTAKEMKEMGMLSIRNMYQKMSNRCWWKSIAMALSSLKQRLHQKTNTNAISHTISISCSMVTEKYLSITS